MNARRLAKTVEEAIAIVRAENIECEMEWYSLGKTNADLFAYLKQAGIDERELGVFIIGSLEEPPPIGRKLLFWPIDWVDLSDQARDTCRKYLAAHPQ